MLRVRAFPPAPAARVQRLWQDQARWQHSGAHRYSRYIEWESQIRAQVCVCVCVGTSEGRGPGGRAPCCACCEPVAFRPVSLGCNCGSRFLTAIKFLISKNGGVVGHWLPSHNAFPVSQPHVQPLRQGGARRARFPPRKRCRSPAPASLPAAAAAAVGGTPGPAGEGGSSSGGAAAVGG